MSRKKNKAKKRNRDKNKHVHSESNDCSRSSKEICAKSEMDKKTHLQSMKVKSEVDKDAHGRKHRALNSPVKRPSSSSGHYKSTSTKTSSKQNPEALTKERGKRTNVVASEEPEAEGKKKLIKRKASKDDDYPVSKRRSIIEQAEVSKREIKKIERKEKERASDQKQSSHEKGQSQHLSKESQNVTPTTEDKSETINPPTSRENPPSSAPPLRISFKIPKKSNVVKTHTSTADWAKDQKSVVTCKKTDSEVKVSQEKNRTKPTKVSSPVPARSRPVLQAQSGRTKETSVSSRRNDLVDHTSCYNVSPKCTELPDDDYEMQIVEELHLARSSRQLLAKVEKSFGELTSMDVDASDEGQNQNHHHHHHHLYQHQEERLIVLDTNVLLSHLDFVRKIRSHGLGSLGFPTLLVPWVVLQELDSLKSGKLSKTIERKAQPAVHFIYTSLKNQEPRLWGQSMQQMSQAACGLSADNNDDRVLQCCLQYKAMFPESAVILCTNDKNLCSKALLSGVQALSKADLQQKAEVNADVHHRYSQTSAYPHAAPVTPHHQEASGRSCEDVEARRNEERARELSESVSVMESSLQSALSAILEEEMKAAFEDLWLEIVYMKPPWSLDALLLCFRKHWFAVFGVIIRRSLISCVETLSSFFRTDASVERNSLLNAVSAAEELLTELRSRSSYSGHVDSALSCLKNLQHRLQAKKSPVDDQGDDTLMADAVQDVAPPTQASHQEVWAFFESIWNNVCHASSAVFSALHFSPGTVGSVEPRPTSPAQDALSWLHRLNSALEQLLESFQRLLSVGSTVEDAQALLNFNHTSEIAAMEAHFTARDLFECLSHQEYREKLRIGGTQLMELRENLHRCAAAVCETNARGST